jgi:hemoglobin
MTTMFERYGGFASVSKIVMSFYDKVLDSEIAGPYFDDIDMRALIDHQTKFVAQVMGGPVEYTNEALRSVHSRHDIDSQAFNEVAALLRETLEDFDFDPADVNQILNEVTRRSPYIVSS